MAADGTRNAPSNLPSFGFSPSFRLPPGLRLSPTNQLPSTQIRLFVHQLPGWLLGANLILPHLSMVRQIFVREP